jgi:adenosylcobinamide kinase / adenosylcobinamide-phosphate guanylyltransferase
MTGLPPVTLVLGGARSGKSRHAEILVESQPGACIYLATAEAGDAEMADRIARHRSRRGPRWETVEEPLELAATLSEVTGAGRAVLVDCLTLWLTNLLAAGREPAAETERLAACLETLAGPVVLVSNEVGLGVVPENALARAFIDHAGRLHQALGEVAQSVRLLAAGQVLHLKTPAAATGASAQAAP